MTVEEELEKVLQEIEHGFPNICVRDSVDGVWDNWSLSELPSPLAILHVCRMIRSRVLKPTAPTPTPKVLGPKDNDALLREAQLGALRQDAELSRKRREKSDRDKPQ